MSNISRIKWILLIHTAILVSAQENVVINQSAEYMLQCPVKSTDCTNVQWTAVNQNDEVQILGNGMSIYSSYRQYYSLNTTAGYCTLIIRVASTENTAGHINCQNLENGKTVKYFNVYIIADGPLCSSNVPGSDGYAVDGETLSYSCALIYGGGGTSAQVTMSWFSAEAVPLSSTSSSASQNQVTSYYDVVAYKPVVPAYVCRSSFGNKNSTAALVTRDCVVKSVSVKYATTSVKLSRDGTNFVPGTNVTCTADGIPPPTIRWMDSSTGTLYVNGPVIVVGQPSTNLYHCEASNQLNIQSVKSASIMFNNSVNPDEVVKAGTPGWVIPVVVCVPLSILLIIVVICAVWPVCPISRAIRNRRADRLMKDKIRPDELDSSAAATTTPDTSLMTSASQPDIVPKPRPKPRSTASSRPSEAPPPPKKPAMPSSNTSIDSAELLHADISPAPRGADAAKKPRPPRPQPKRTSEAIYTPVVRS